MQKDILLLNASFEPLCAVTLRRAMILLIQDKAVIVASHEDTVRSYKNTMNRPAVLRLSTYRKVPYRSNVPLTRKALMLRDKGTCQYCFDKGDTIDHVLPRARGGRHEWSNVVIACGRCNNKKSDRLLSEIGWSLKTPPVAPHGNSWMLTGAGATEPTWEPFLRV